MLELNRALGRDQDNHPNDVALTKAALWRTGYFDEHRPGSTFDPTEKLFSAIERFQGDHELTVDGLMRPGDETEKALNDKDKIAVAPVAVARCIDARIATALTREPMGKYACRASGFTSPIFFRN